MQSNDGNGTKMTDPSDSNSSFINWEKFGLKSDKSHQNDSQSRKNPDYTSVPSNENELFHQDQLNDESKPWWKAKLMLSEPDLFGTWDGVFTSCFINIFGVIVFMRSGWMVGEAGIGLSVLIILISVVIALTSLLSAIGICDRCQVESGGVYFLVSHVLGSQIGGAIGLLYCFGQAVAVALYAAAFSESMTDLLHINDPWIDRAIAISVVVILVIVNVAGVGWVVRIQFFLLLILMFAGLDFAVGAFVHTDPTHGVIGFSSTNFYNNSGPQFSDDQSLFTIFGVFFPTVTGVFAGINMSGDLRNPSRDIPVGSLAAVGTSTFLYLMFVILLGATCQREALLTNFMIAEKVSAIKVLLLAGVYVSSISSSIATLYGTPRVLQCIANENIIPFIKVLGIGRGPNKVPVVSLVLIAAIALVFILIGQINTLGPIVTMPFMLTYAAVDYSYFSLAMTFNMQRKRDARYAMRRKSSDTSNGSAVFSQKTTPSGSVKTYGATHNKEYGNDLDQLFPERMKSKQGSGYSRVKVTRQQSSVVTDDPESESTVTSPDDHSSIDSTNEQKKRADTTKLIPEKQQWEITSKPQSWYAIFCNRWISILGVIVNFFIMFLVQWVYALISILTVFLIYFYIGRTNPGVTTGLAEFRLIPWLKNGFLRLIGRLPPEYDQIIVTPNHPGVEIMAAQITEDSADYSNRERYHQSSMVHPSTGFHDYQVDD